MDPEPLYRIDLRDRPNYPADPGTGLSIRVVDERIEFGLTWDGAERMLVCLSKDQLHSLHLAAQNAT